MLSTVHATEESGGAAGAEGEEDAASRSRAEALAAAEALEMGLEDDD